MIDTVLVGGSLVGGEYVGGLPIDPCLILAQVTVLHGRKGFGEGSAAGSATITVEHPEGSMPTWRSGDIIRVGGPDGWMFSGRIVERSLSHRTRNDGVSVGQFTVTAAGPLAALGVRKIGDTPWPAELGTERAAHILAAGGTPWRIDGTQDLAVIARDVDAQPAADLLDELAEWTGAAVFDTPDGDVVYQPLSGRSPWRPIPISWSDFDVDLTWDGFDPALSWDWDPPTLADWVIASPLPLVLPCDAVGWEPEWTSGEDTVVNDVTVSYGTADPQATVDLDDDASVAAHGVRHVTLSTGLATVTDGNARAAHIITTQKDERWQIGDVTVALDLLDVADREAALALICGDHVTLQGLPQPAPAIDWTGIVEGWTYTMWASGGVFHEQMVLALSDPLLSLAVMIWDDYPTPYLWSDHPDPLIWDSLETVDVLEAA